MQKQTLTITALSILLVSTIFINTTLASNQTAYTIQSSGTITQGTTNNSESVKVIVRHLGNPMPSWTSNISANVDMWITTNPWIKGGAVIIDVEDIAPILWFNQSGYKEYVFNTAQGTWSACGWTFAQLKTLIDSFHTNNVSVVLGITAICKDTTNSAWSSNIYKWIVNDHPELAFSHPDGNLYLSALGGHSAPLNWFANFTSNDPTSGATKGESVVHLFNTRLSEMINAGLEWDGFFGSEGFGSIGVWGGSSNTTFIDATSQSMSKWANWTDMTLPSNWNNMTTSAHVQWVMKNASMNYQEFAGYLYASNLFSPIHDTIQRLRESSGRFIGLIFSPDETWQDTQRASRWGGWSPEVGYNATYLAQYCSASTYIYYVDQEGTDWSQTMNQQETYTASSVKSSNLNFNVVIGLHTLNNNGEPAPISWLYKEYLAEACNYVWVGGQRYTTTNQNIIVIQYPDNSSQIGYFRSELNTFFDWVAVVRNTLSSSTPAYLGATYTFISMRQCYVDKAWSSLNYTFLQWIETDNLSNKPQNLNWEMNTLFIPQASIWNKAGGLKNVQDQILSAFANGSLSLIVDSETTYMDAGILQGELFSGIATSNPLSTFRVSGPSEWKNDNSTRILNQIDTNAQWIIGNYSGRSYTLPSDKWYSQSSAFNIRGYYPSTDFIEISEFTYSNLIQYGIYYNNTSGRFIYGQYFDLLPADLINRGIEWATDPPITSNNSLVQNAGYTTQKGIAIPMWNMQDDKMVCITLNINATELDLGPISDYEFSWGNEQSKTWTETSWENVANLTLKNGADILIISHK